MDSITCYEAAYRMRQQNININQIAIILGRNKATIYRWLKSIHLAGIKLFLHRKRTCKHRRPNGKTPEYIAQKVVDIRNKRGYCGFKIQKELKEVHGIKLSLATIYRILHERFTRHAVGVKRYKKHQPIVTSCAPREVVEHDTVDLGGGKYAYTSIDVFTKEPIVIIAEDLTMATGKEVFVRQKSFYGAVGPHQSDNGSEFQTDFVSAVIASGSNHRYSRPYKKNEQSHIENFNKSLRSECFPKDCYIHENVKTLQKLADEYCHFFIHERWHMGLPDCMTPRQFMKYYKADPERARMELTALHGKRNGGNKSCSEG